MSALRKNKHHNVLRVRRYVAFALTLAVLIWVIILFTKSKLNGYKYYSLLLTSTTGNYQVLAVNKVNKSVNKVLIPENIYTEVSRNLGKMQLKNILRRIESEKLPVIIVSETVTRHIKIPINIYIGSRSSKFLIGNTWEKIKWIISKADSDLPIRDRLSIMAFVWNSSKIKTYDPIDQGYFKQGKSVDGNTVYLVSDKYPEYLKSIYNSAISEDQLTAILVHDDDVYQSKIKSFSELLDVLGVRVFTIEKKQELLGNCEFLALEKNNAQMLERYTGCNFVGDVQSENTDFDFIISLGDNFNEFY